MPDRLSSPSSVKILIDFDGTAARTGDKSPRDLNVAQACEVVIGEMFSDQGLDLYKSEQVGSLRNRAPSELIQFMLQLDPSLVLIAKAVFLEKKNGLGSELVPEGKGWPLEWNDAAPAQSLAEFFVRRKLQLLMNEIQYDEDKLWPLPCTGFLEFWYSLQSLKAEGVNILTGVVSSGHERFITKTFETWGAPLPDVMITEDDVRGMKIEPHQPEWRVKPGFVPLIMAYWRMQELEHQLCRECRVAAPFLDGNVLYVGDHEEKDVGMARNNHVVGLHFQEGAQVKGLKVENDGWLARFSDWQVLSQFLERHHPLLESGIPFNRLFQEYHVGIEGSRRSTKEGAP